jgi:predicted nucleic acid-binding protein
LVSAVNPDDKYHNAGMAHLSSLRSPEEVCVPTSTLTEFDLVLRNRGYDETEVRETWAALAPLIGDKITAVTPSAHLNAAEMRSRGLSYFDSLIAALAKQIGAIVVTRDPQIARQVRTEW